MTVHSFHGDIHQRGLIDGCPRCQELAQAPWDRLDGRMLKNLYDRVQQRQPPRSENERIAMGRIHIPKNLR